MPRRAKVLTGASAFSEGAVLRAAREERGRSLTYVAEEAPFAKSYLSGVENGVERVNDALIEGYARVLGLPEKALQQRIEAVRSDSPAKAIEQLVNNAQLWAATPSMFTTKDLFATDNTAENRFKQVLRNAAEQFLLHAHDLPTRARYRRTLLLLSAPGTQGEKYRTAVQYALSSPDDVQSADKMQELVPDVSAENFPFLQQFAAALRVHLNIDPLFRQELHKQQGAVPEETPAIRTIVEGLNTLYDTLDYRYTVAQFQRDVERYTQAVEERFRSLHSMDFALKQRESSPSLNAIFVPVSLLIPTNDATHTTTQSAPQNTHAQSLHDQTERSTPVRAGTLNELLARSSQVVLLGEAGMGKSMLMSYLAWSHAKAQLDASFVTSQPLLPRVPIPLYIELRRFMEGQQEQRYDEKRLLEYVVNCLPGDQRVSPALFEALLTRRGMLVLFDGLDEIVEITVRKRIVQMIEHVVQRYPGNIFLVTSRPFGYELAPLSDLFARAELQSLTPSQMESYAERWYRYLGHTGELPADQQEDLTNFQKIILGKPALRQLAENPLLLTVITIQHRSEHLADKRGDVYESCAQLLLTQWTLAKDMQGHRHALTIGQSDQYLCIAYLAHVMHLENLNTIATGRLRSLLEDFLYQEQMLIGATKEELQAEAQQLVALMNMEAGLIVQQGSDQHGEKLYSFIRLPFQEYFAATYLYESYLQETDPQEVSSFLDQYLYQPHWREVILLLLSKLARKPVTQQLQRLLEQQSNYNALLRQNLFFVCDCLLDEIAVMPEFGERVITELNQLIHLSPFLSQRRMALEYLVRMTHVQQFKTLVSGILHTSLHDETVVLAERLNKATIVYQKAPPDSALRQEAFHLLAQAAQEPERTFYDVVYFLMILQQDGGDEETQRRLLSIWHSIIQHRTIKQPLHEWANNLFAFLGTLTFEGWAEAALPVVLCLLERNGDVPEQQIRLVEMLIWGDKTQERWWLVMQLWQRLEQVMKPGDRAELALKLYHRSSESDNYDSSIKKELHNLTQQTLLDLLEYPELKQSLSMHIMKTGGDITLRESARRQLLGILEQRPRSRRADTPLLLEIAIELYTYATSVSEQQQALAHLVKLPQRRDVDSEQLAHFAWHIYQRGSYNVQSDEHKQHGLQLLLAITQHRSPPVELLLPFVRTILQINSTQQQEASGESEQALSLLAALLHALTLPQLVELATQLLAYCVNRPAGRQLFLRALLAIVQNKETTAGHLERVMRDSAYLNDISGLQQEINRVLLTQAENEQLSIAQRSLVLTSLLAGRHVAYAYKAQAMQIACSLLAEDAARELLQQWQPAQQATVADAPYLEKIAQQPHLRESCRDQAYVALRGLLPNLSGEERQ